MKKQKIFFLIFSTAGVLFSGYMISVKLFSKTCAFGETCPLFLGIPACYFGFILFFALFILSIFLASYKHKDKILTNSIFWVSFLGTLFAFRFSVGELPLLFKNGLSFYKFGLPTCLLGFFFFLIIFIFSILFKKRVKHL